MRRGHALIGNSGGKNNPKRTLVVVALTVWSDGFYRPEGRNSEFKLGAPRQGFTLGCATHKWGLV